MKQGEVLCASSTLSWSLDLPNGLKSGKSLVLSVVEVYEKSLHVLQARGRLCQNT